MSIESYNFPTTGLIDSSTGGIVTCLKKIATQLRTFSKIWGKKPCNKRDEEIYKRLLCINRKVSQIQTELQTIGTLMEESIETNEISIPETITLTTREFAILNKVFMKYTESIEDAPAYSLFGI